MLPCFRTDDKKEDPCVTYNPYMSIGTPALPDKHKEAVVAPWCMATDIQ